MWGALTSIREGEANVAVSCGNTGALMALAMICLRRAPGVSRPAIAILWPSRNPQQFNVMLDVGADVRANAEDLLKYALMGVSYSGAAFGLERPRVGLLNVGTEEHKGREELRSAHELIAAASASNRFEFVGFVEGLDIPSTRLDVIVTDGFTGNVALKTAEGTAQPDRGLAARRVQVLAALAHRDAVRAHVARAAAAANRSAARQRRRFSRSERYSGQVARFGRFNGSRGCHRTCLQAVQPAIPRKTLRARCIRRRGKVKLKTASRKMLKTPNRSVPSC